MPTTFDEVLLDEMYSAVAEGGPEFSTAIIRSGSGGSVASRAETREDYQSKYEINYGELANARRSALRKFAILRKGMARGFRFLAPDDHELVDENLGWLNPATGEVEYLEQVPEATTLSEFYLVKHYSDPANSYTRRLVKPSLWDDLTFTLYDVDTDTELGSITISAGSALLPYDVVPETVEFTIFTPGGYDFTLYPKTGRVESALPIGEYWILRATGTYHIPVAFTDDWHKASIDETTISAIKVGIEEILPVELNIT